MDVYQERDFNILENFDGNLMLLIKARITPVPKNSYIEYDGGDHAILHRGADVYGESALTVILDYIHPKVREKFLNSEKVLVVETYPTGRNNGFGISNEYNCPVRKVEKVDLSPYNLETVKK